MAEGITTLSPQHPKASRTLTSAALTDVVWDCLWEALWLAFLVQMCGSVALGLAAGVWRDMMPSLPPGWAQPSAPAAWGWGFFQHHQFALIYAVMFAGKAAGPLVAFSHSPRHRKAAAWVLRASRKLSRQWFELTMGNALAAFLAVLGWQLAQQASFSGLIGQFVLGLFSPVLHGLASFLPGHEPARAVADLVAWYQSNQFKFAFWLFYSAGICDDLGLPNYKTLLRWLSWRIRKRVLSVG